MFGTEFDDVDRAIDQIEGLIAAREIAPYETAPFTADRLRRIFQQQAA